MYRIKCPECGKILTEFKSKCEDDKFLFYKVEKESSTWIRCLPCYYIGSIKEFTEVEI